MFFFTKPSVLDQDPDMTAPGEALVLRQIVSSPKVLSKTMSLPAGSRATKLVLHQHPNQLLTNWFCQLFHENFYSEPFTDNNNTIFLPFLNLNINFTYQYMIHMLSEAFTGEHIYSGPSPLRLLELFQPSPLPLKISRVDIISHVNGVNGVY